MKRILITLQLMLLVQLTIANPEATIDFKSNTSRASMMPVYTPETIESGSLIIDMGQVPQTTENALLPYGLVYALVKDLQVPVEWVISSSKSKDGTDFSADGMSFKGAPFIIKAEFITPAVLALVSTWEAMGVVTHTLASAAIAPIYSTINYVPGWTLDAGNGGIAEGYINNAGIPESAYNWKLPGELDCCDDLFAMPHADPEWFDGVDLAHGNLYDWNLTCKGGIWAACHAVSALELMFNPNDPTQQTNFLSVKTGTATGGGPYSDPYNSLVEWGNHGEADAPYDYFLPTAPPMQFLGIMDDALQNGSEQSYLPIIGGQWRPTTQIGVSISNHPDYPSLSLEPAKVIFGQAFGDANRGKVMYEAGHSHDGGDPANIAAQRAFLNFSFWAAADNAIQTTIAGVVPAAEGGNDVYNLSATASGGTGNFTYQWVSDCPGTFANANGSSTTFTPDFVEEGVACVIKCIVQDNCGTRTAFSSGATTIVPAPVPPVANDDDEFTNPGVPVTFAPLDNDTDLNLDIDPSSLTFWNSTTMMAITSPVTTANGGTFSINFDGTVNYVSDPGFTGTETIDYQICDETLPADGGPFCDVATITILVDLTDEFGCSPTQQYGKLYTGYAVSQTSNTTVVVGDFALGYPEGLAINKAAALNHAETPQSSITITLGSAVIDGGIINIHGWANDADGTTFSVTSSDNGADFTNPQNYTAPDKTQSHTFQYTVDNTEGVTFLTITSTSTTDKFFLDGISYDVNACKDICVLPFVDLVISGSATLDDPTSTSDKPEEAIGLPDFVPSGVAVGEFLILDLSETIPVGEIIQIFAANNSTSPEPTLNVSGSTDGGTFTDIVSYLPANDKDFAYDQLFYTVTQAGGLRYLRFDGVDEASYVDAVIYDIATCEEGIPVAVDDVTYTLEGIPTTYPVQINDNDLQGDPITTTQITSDPSNGSASINPDGTITYIPNADFVGTDVLTYEICDDGGLCAEATLTIIIPDDGCGGDPGQAPQVVGKGYGFTVADPDNDVSNEDNAIGVPDDVIAVLNKGGNIRLDVVFSETVFAGDIITYYVASDGLQVDYTVEIFNGTSWVDAEMRSVTGTTIQAIEYLVSDAAGAQQIRFTNNDADDKLSVDAVEYNRRSCISACAAGDLSTQSNGYAIDIPVTPASDDGDANLAIGAPDGIYSQLGSTEFLYIDFGQTLAPSATEIIHLYFYIGENGGTTVDVKTSATTTFSGSATSFTVTDYSADFQQFQLEITADTRYVQFSGADGNIFIDAVEYYINACEDNTPIAVNDNAFTAEDTPVTYAVQDNDSDPQGDLLSTTQVTVDPTNGSYIINPDGTITYTPDPEFTGTDQLTYEICDPFNDCATAILFITVEADPCGATESNIIIGTGYGFSQTNVGAGNPDLAIGIPDGVLVAVLSDGNEYLVLNLNNTVVPGDQICFYVAGEAGNTTTFDVTFSNNGTHPGTLKTESFSITGAGLQQLCSTIDFAGGASYIHFENTSTVNNENLSIDGVEYNLRACVPTGCIVSDEAFVQTGYGQEAFLSGAANTTVTGAPDGINEKIKTGDLDTMIIDMGSIIPQGSVILYYVSGIGTGVIQSSDVLGSYTNDVTFTPTSPAAFFQQRSYTVTQSSGIQYLRFYATTGEYFLDAVQFITYESNSLSGYVFDDSIGENGTFESATEDAFEGVTVKIYTDSDASGTVNAGDVLIATEFTDANGFYSYQFFDNNLPTNYVIEVDESTLPGTPVANYYTTGQYQTATLTTASDSDCDNNFGRAFDNPPVAVDDAATTEQNLPIIIDLIDNDQNPDIDGEVTTVTSIISPPSSGGSVSINPDGTADYSPPVGFVGTETFTYLLCDEADPGLLCDTATVTVTVTPFVNDPPVAVDDVATTEQDEPINIVVLTNDSDPEGGNISPPTCIGTDADAATPTVCDGMTAQGGTVTILPNGEIYYEPPVGYTGPDQVTYVICDPLGLCDDAVINITVTADVNDPPIASNDNFNVYDACGATVLNVIDNDYDPDGSLNPASITITTPLSPATGTLTNNLDGTFSYTSAGAGTYTFEYQVCDDGIPTPIECDLATVTITVPVLNTAPVALDDIDDIFAGQTLTTAVLGNDSDPDGDNLTVTLCTGLATGCGLTTTTSTAGGTATVQASGKIQLVPLPGFTGADSYFYEICDDGCPSLCDQATVTVTFENQAPVAVDDQDQTSINVDINIDVTDNDFDPEGVGLVINTAGSDPNSPTGNGTTQGGSVVINMDGTIDYSPPSNFIGLDTFYYEVCEDIMVAPLCDIAEVIVTITSLIDVEIVKTVFPENPDAGDNVTYTLTISNTSLGDATGVIVKDKLPSGLSYVSDSGNGAYDEGSGFWSVGDITSGSSKSIQIVATVVDFIDAENVAEITSHNEVDADSTPNNNELAEDDQSAVILQCELKYSQIGVIKN